MIRKLLSISFLLLMAMASGGCFCHPTKLTISIDMDEALRAELKSRGGRTVQVDIVGLNANQHARLEGYSMTDYWNPGDTTRASLPSWKKAFDPNVPGPIVLSADDPIWNQWQIWEKNNISDKDMPRLYILVQLPKASWDKGVDDQVGEKDPRRQILPLGDCRWKTKNVSILIQRSGVITLTQQVRDNKNQ